MAGVNSISKIMIVLLGALVFFLFKVKQNVAGCYSALIATNKIIKEEQNSIHVLQAELAYLYSPKRIMLLSNKYLPLHNIDIAQINSSARIVKTEIASNISSSNVQNVKWRYKKANNYSIKHVSTK